MLLRWYLGRLILHPEYGRDVPPKQWLTFNEPHGVVSKKIALSNIVVFFAFSILCRALVAEICNVEQHLYA
jgi:hypothetical protein